MNVYGREYGFFYSVGAEEQIANVPENSSVRMRAAAFAVAMSRADEKRKHYENREYVEDPLTLDMALSLSHAEFDQMCDEAKAAYDEGMKRLVEVEEDKKKETSKASS